MCFQAESPTPDANDPGASYSGRGNIQRREMTSFCFVSFGFECSGLLRRDSMLKLPVTSEPVISRNLGPTGTSGDMLLV